MDNQTGARNSDHCPVEQTLGRTGRHVVSSAAERNPFASIRQETLEYEPSDQFTLNHDYSSSDALFAPS
jgi:hypothetical protein